MIVNDGCLGKPLWLRFVTPTCANSTPIQSLPTDQLQKMINYIMIFDHGCLVALKPLYASLYQLVTHHWLVVSCATIPKNMSELISQSHWGKEKSVKPPARSTKIYQFVKPSVIFV